MLRAALILVFTLISPLLCADDEIYVAKDKPQQNNEQNEEFLGWDLENWAVQVNLASYHPNNSSDYNQFNPGIGLEYHYEHFFLTGGYFYNSLDKNSFYAGIGKELTWGTHLSFGLGAIAGALTGYESGQEPRFAALPYLFITKDRLTLRAFYIPEVGRVEDDAIGFALRYKFD